METMSEKYFNVDIDDPRASAIAEVMSNKTAKKILSLISEKEVSESDIASELNIPLNTVGYNIDKLLKAGLIERSKNFFWSVKGKKIPTYRLSNRKILISPKKMVPSAPFAIIGAIIGLILIVALFGTMQKGYLSNSGSNITNADALKKFSSYNELQQFLANSSANANRNAASNLAYPASASSIAAGASASSETSQKAADYSQTNVQVAGVDEPDIVKNDGKYIYAVNGNSVEILDAYPAEQMHNVSAIGFNESIQSIFVNGDKLVVFGNSYGPVYYRGVETAKITASTSAGASVAMPCLGCGYGNQNVVVYVYDISDRQDPKLEGNISVSGNFIAARMIGDYVYLVSNEYADLQAPILPLYSVNGVEKQAAATDIYYPPYQDNGYEFTSIYSINLNNNKVNSQTYLLGASSNVYVSENNIYLTYLKQLSYNDEQERMINEAIMPILPDDMKEQAKNIMNSDKDAYVKYGEINDLVTSYSNSLAGSAKSEFDSSLKKALSDFQIKIARESERTVVNKIAIDNGDISYVGNGEVGGHLLNQFSMDEYNGNLRIATTLGQTWQGSSVSQIAVLDKSLKQIDNVGDIAPGESIYAVRFLGSRAYVVTFKSIDPFFVIDLSNPNNPKVLGYLKIPGYSDYLHPYDETHIIGIGKEANESIDANLVHSPGAIYYTAIGGVKISLFDVSDIEHPVENAKIVIGDRGSDSYALSDHKAFLFDKEKGMLVIPIMVDELQNVSYLDYYGNNRTYEQEMPVWQGAYVFNINENNITVRGRITHFDNESNDTYKFYDYRYQIERSLFMDNALYTVSPSMIKVNDLDNLTEISKIDLSYQNIYPMPLY